MTVEPSQFTPNRENFIERIREGRLRDHQKCLEVKPRLGSLSHTLKHADEAAELDLTGAVRAYLQIMRDEIDAALAGLPEK